MRVVTAAEEAGGPGEPPVCCAGCTAGMRSSSKSTIAGDIGETAPLSQSAAGDITGDVGTGDVGEATTVPPSLPDDGSERPTLTSVMGASSVGVFEVIVSFGIVKAML